MKRLNYQKGISSIIAVILLSVILIGGGIYYFGQCRTGIFPTRCLASAPVAVDATATWKTYTSVKYGIEFKYPPELKLQENVDNVRILQGMGYIFEVGRIDNIDIETWISSQRQIKIVEGIPPYIISKAEFKQRPAYYLKQATLAQVPMDRFAVQVNNYILTITHEVADNLDFYSNPSDKQRVEKANKDFISTEKIIIDQILSTFKFTDAIANWKTYANTQYGFEIKYPNSLYPKDYIAPVIAYFEETKYRNEQPLHRPSITIDAITTSLTPKEWAVKNDKNTIQLQDNKRTTIENAVIGTNDIPSIKFYSEAVSSGSTHTVIKVSNNSLIDISLNSSPNGEISSDIYNKILSTLKFTVYSAPYGHYFTPHSATHYLEIYPDGTFRHNTILPCSSTGPSDLCKEKLVSGTYTLSNENLTLTYDDKNIKGFQLRLFQGKPPLDNNWYITGKADGWEYYFVRN